MGFDFASSAWFLTGPTASGKSKLGLELAEQAGAEIIALDSMTVYRGLDIGTAKPSPAEQRRVRHHLIDLIDVDQEFSVAQYLMAAERVVRDVRGRGKTPLFVGGTPLYLKALLRGLFEGPPADWELRARWERAAAGEGPDWLREQLRRVDPETAAKLHPNDARRLIRALEVFEKTGVPISRLQRQFDVGRPAAECRVVVLTWPREVLYERIDRRVEAMVNAGWEAEVHDLLARFPQWSRTARQAVGYREMIAYLGGEGNRRAMIERIQWETHRFARKQITWFRGLSECRWIDALPGQSEGEILAELRRQGLSAP